MLQGKHCLLRPYQVADIERMIAHFNIPEVYHMLRTAVPFTVTHAEKRITSPLLFAIDVDGFAGEIGIHSVIKGHKAELFYSLLPALHGKGIMTEAVQMLSQWVFSEFQLIRLQAYVYSFNPASARVLEKCGFLCEGRLRKDTVRLGKVIDSLIYSKIA